MPAPRLISPCRLKYLQVYSDVYVAILDLNGINFYLLFFGIQTSTGLKRKCFFMEWAGNFGFAIMRSNHSPGKRHLHFMRTHILTRVPFISPGKIENSYLLTLIFDTCSAILGKIRNLCRPE